MGRKLRKRDFRRLWIVRINAAVQAEGLNYSQFMHGMKLANIEINRKALSNMAIEDKAAFKTLVDQVKVALANKGTGGSMSVIDTVRLLELERKGRRPHRLLRREKEELQQRFDLVLAHNRELEGYIEAYTTSEKLVEQSIATAMATLDTIDGLDEIQVFDDASLELEAADTFTGAEGGLSSEDVDWDALLDDLPEL